MYSKQLKIACPKKRGYKNALGLALLLAMSAASIQAQEAVGSAGGTASTNGGSVSYTVGQIVYTTNSATAGSVEQGVQQAYSISVISALPNTEGIRVSCAAYPNPTSDYLTLSLAGFKSDNLRFDLFDNNGRVVKQANIAKEETKIEMSDLVSSNYFLKITSGDTIVKTFTIIKQN